MKTRYLGQTGFEHGRPARLGIVLVNLGTPEAPTAAALRRYLAEFLADPRVVEIPRPFWWPILHGVVLRIRPRRSAEAYRKVWTDDGSPLMVSCQRLAAALEETLAERIPGPHTVALAMRYGQPSIDSVLRRLQDEGAERLLVVPLYPQYSGATTGSVADAVFASLRRWRWVPELRLTGAYHDDPRYIDALAASIRRHWQSHGRGDRLMISFHGMPRATLEAGDPYYCQCHKTARLLAGRLELDADEWEMAFQSRFGAAEWLKPYVVERLSALPGEGIRRLTVVCPGFANDCLETLEEIAMQGRETFLAAGGDRLDYVPALNESPDHVALQAERIVEQAAGWPELAGDWSDEKMEATLCETRRLAEAGGA